MNFHYRVFFVLLDDVCRARLRPTGAPGADYINASFVDVSRFVSIIEILFFYVCFRSLLSCLFQQGYKLKNAYIATQGPMSNTVHDFWRMIWEFKSKAIVQLCQLEENGIVSPSAPIQMNK